MGVLDSLKAGGYKPKASQDGIWEPYTGVYKVSWDVCRKEIDEKNGNVAFIQAEWGIKETLGGMEKRTSKYADFRRRYYIEGENAEKNMQAFLDDAFTFGIDLSNESDATLESRFVEIIGKEGFLRSWAWTPDGKDSPVQMTTLQQEKAALKSAGKYKKDSPF